MGRVGAGWGRLRGSGDAWLTDLIEAATPPPPSLPPSPTSAHTLPPSAPNPSLNPAWSLTANFFRYAVIAEAGGRRRGGGGGGGGGGGAGGAGGADGLPAEGGAEPAGPGEMMKMTGGGKDAATGKQRYAGV